MHGAFAFVLVNLFGDPKLRPRLHDVPQHTGAEEDQILPTRRVLDSQFEFLFVVVAMWVSVNTCPLHV